MWALQFFLFNQHLAAEFVAVQNARAGVKLIFF
jgi:hypothetical protein